MNELIAKIEAWAEDRNIINGSKPIDQAMKLFSEFGELADNVGKGRDCRDDIGDVFVVLTIMAKQEKISIKSAAESSEAYESELKNLVIHLSQDISDFSVANGLDESLALCLSGLKSLCAAKGYTLEECVQIAYDDIKDRTGIMHNGVFIKSTDPQYDAICMELGK